MWGTGMNSGWLWLYGIVAMASLVVVIVWSVRALRHGDGPSPVDPRPADRGPAETAPGSSRPDAAPSDARRRLDDRLARGEITADEHREQLRRLGEEP